MKIERISESQIRCTLSDFDLSERNMNLSELAYGSDKARRLFDEMLQQANTQVGFDVEDIPIMVEAIPLSNQSVMLVITKVDDPEEMDARYSRFAPLPEGFFYPGVSEDSDLGLEQAELFRSKHLPSSAPQDSPAKDGETAASAENESGDGSPADSSKADASPQTLRTRVFTFSSLDRVIDAACALPESTDASAAAERLYKNPADGSFCLVLEDNGTNPAGFAVLCNRLAEYGTRSRAHYSGDSYYQEHFETILKERVLSSLRKIG